MDMLILKTDINTKHDFRIVKNYLSRFYKIDNCTIDLEDIDKVVRVIGKNIIMSDVVDRIKSFGYLCEELED